MRRSIVVAFFAVILAVSASGGGGPDGFRFKRTQYIPKLQPFPDPVRHEPSTRRTCGCHSEHTETHYHVRV
jgi:hypothetical protein